MPHFFDDLYSDGSIWIGSTESALMGHVEVLVSTSYPADVGEAERWLIDQFFKTEQEHLNLLQEKMLGNYNDSRAELQAEAQDCTDSGDNYFPEIEGYEEMLKILEPDSIYIPIQKGNDKGRIQLRFSSREIPEVLFCADLVYPK